MPSTRSVGLLVARFKTAPLRRITSRRAVPAGAAGPRSSWGPDIRRIRVPPSGSPARTVGGVITTSLAGTGGPGTGPTWSAETRRGCVRRVGGVLERCGEWSISLRSHATRRATGTRSPCGTGEGCIGIPEMITDNPMRIPSTTTAHTHRRWWQRRAGSDERDAAGRQCRHTDDERRPRHRTVGVSREVAGAPRAGRERWQAKRRTA